MGGTETQIVTPGWRVIKSGLRRMDALAGGSFALDESSVGSALGTPTGGFGIFYLDSSDGRSGANLKCRFVIATNNTAPGTVVFTVQLRPVTGVAGGAGQVNPSVAASVATVTISSPPANALLVATSSPFAPPADGFYMLLGANDVAMAASSSAVMRGVLYRQN